MRSIDPLVNRFPSHEFAIRRLYGSHPEFRAVCEDYREVKGALEHWQAVSGAVPGRAAEYRRMLDELEAEALGYLSRFGAR